MKWTIKVVRVAFVRRGSSEAATAVDRALRSCGVDEKTSLTVLTDGDAGLRAIQQQIAPKAEHILDWFHVAMRFQNLGQSAKGINELNDAVIRRHALDELEITKWRLWNDIGDAGSLG